MFSLLTGLGTRVRTNGSIAAALFHLRGAGGLDRDGRGNMRMRLVILEHEILGLIIEQ